MLGISLLMVLYLAAAFAFVVLSVLIITVAMYCRALHVIACWLKAAAASTL
jgi:hypothetical protein